MEKNYRFCTRFTKQNEENVFMCVLFMFVFFFFFTSVNELSTKRLVPAVTRDISERGIIFKNVRCFFWVDIGWLKPSRFFSWHRIYIGPTRITLFFSFSTIWYIGHRKLFLRRYRNVENPYFPRKPSPRWVDGGSPWFS